jgi:uncharacterized Rmd1/YagE family protein
VSCITDCLFRKEADIPQAYFDSVFTEFEIKERIESFNRKIDYAQEIQSTLRALLTEVSSFPLNVFEIELISAHRLLAIEWN